MLTPITGAPVAPTGAPFFFAEASCRPGLQAGPSGLTRGPARAANAQRASGTAVKGWEMAPPSPRP
jgi:hypothetical protein